jgi:hypothetical protein
VVNRVDREEKQRQMYIDIPYKQARAILKEHQLHDTAALGQLIHDEEIRITNLLNLQEKQVVAAQAEEAIRKAAEMKRIADEKAERDRLAKEAAERQKKHEEDTKRAADEAAARQRALEQKQKQDAAAAIAAAVPAKTATPAVVAPVAAAAAPAPAAAGGGSNTIAYAEFQRRHAKLQGARAAANAFAENPMQALQVKKTINLQINSLAATQEQVKLKVSG